MRKVLFLILVSLAFVVNAKHLEFMGIPINGTISSFQTKLLAKGCSLMKNNKEIPVGVRGFKGVFAGKKCEIFVFFNHRTKQVYKVRALADCGPSIDSAHSTFYYYKNLLDQKYFGRALTSDMLEESDKEEYAFEMMIFEPPIQEGAQLNGRIELGILDLEDWVYDQIVTVYGVAIDYEDFENSSKNEENTLNDL